MATIIDLKNNTVLRQETNVDLTTVNRELTFEEGDNFRIWVYELLKTISAASGVTPYNALTTYTGTQYVSYGGNLWVHISASPSLGITPSLGVPTIWELTSIGSLVHAQNTDTILGLGSGFDTTVEDLFSLVEEQVIPISMAAFDALVVAGTLIPNRSYRIANELFPDSFLFIRSVNVSNYSLNALLAIRLPNIAAVPVIWESGATYSATDRVVYGGYVYTNLTGSNTTTPPDSDGTNWSQEPPSTTSIYEYQYLELSIGSSGGVIFTTGGKDMNGNEYSSTDILTRQIFLNDANYYGNKTDSFGGLSGACNLIGSVNGNKTVISSMTFAKGGVLSGGGVDQNILTKSTITCDQEFNGAMIGNVLVNTTLYLVDGLDTTKLIQNCKFEFASPKSFTIRADYTLSNGNVNEQGSTLSDTIVITGLTVINLSTNGHPDAYGVIVASSTNATESITRLTNGANLIPIKIAPEIGLTLTVTTTLYASVSAHGQIVGGAGSYVLNGTKADYLIVEPIVVGAFNVYRVKESSIVL